MNEKGTTNNNTYRGFKNALPLCIIQKCDDLVSHRLPLQYVVHWFMFFIICSAHMYNM